VRAMADVRDVSEASMATTLWNNAQKVFGPF
jgi:Tat protein secretion system quality control protein TatD with DNase activity